ncbi:A/G-specific adenine glycosylase [soil metagenome]
MSVPLTEGSALQRQVPTSRAEVAGIESGESFASELIQWQRSHGRNKLPWQNTRDPYRVWLSEIMLQQTQVATVLGYYERFLQRFPDVAALAAAPLDDVLSMWSGLGYYARGRNLHSCAQAVVARHGGVFPPSSAVLAELPGIGRTTAAAIAAFCFGERVAILDGNVKRVLTRVLAFDGDLASASAERDLWAMATSMLPAEGEGIESYTQGVMDLGATICTQRAPQCLLCPVNQRCAALRTGQPERYPVKTRKLKRSRRENDWLLLQWRGKLWLTQRPPTGIWAALWSLPEFEDVRDVAAGWPGTVERQDSVVHVLTHLDWLLKPVVWTLPDDADSVQVDKVLASLPAGRWVTSQEALTLGLPAPLRRLIERQPEMQAER